MIPSVPAPLKQTNSRRKQSGHAKPSPITPSVQNARNLPRIGEIRKTLTLSSIQISPRTAKITINAQLGMRKHSGNAILGRLINTVGIQHGQQKGYATNRWPGKRPAESDHERLEGDDPHGARGSGRAAYLVRQANENPVAFMALISKVISKEIDATIRGGINVYLTKAELHDA